MKTRIAILLILLALGSAAYAAEPAGKKENASAPVVRNSDDTETMRVHGEQRFRANCGRCHAAPHKFPPRMMATIVRHMRVRATITDDDMRLILFYMTQ